MQEILAGRLVILPCASPKAGSPVIGSIAVLLRIPPDVIVTVRVVLSFQSFLKPSVLIRSMVDNEIHDDLKAQAVSCPKHLIKILHRAEFRIDRLVIADIIAVIVIWRLIDRGEPDHIRPQLPDVWQTFCNAGYIADPVPVAVLKAPRINLINNAALPPFPIHKCNSSFISYLRRQPPARVQASAYLRQAPFPSGC